jgi:DNA-binding response OmpR family regulator
VFLTASDTVEQRLAGFAAGADDYLVKPFALEELLARIRALMRRSGRAGGVYRVGDLHVDEAARTVSRGRLLRLTKTDFDVLIVLLRNRGKVVHKELLLNEVWGYTGSPDLLQTHMSSLRRKLEEHGPRLIHTVHGVGYSLHPL